MTCDEFRSLWLDSPMSAGLLAHSEACSACAAWRARSALLDDVLGAALIVSPPPGLAVRLHQLPRELVTTAPASTIPPPGGRAMSGLLLLVLIALGGIGLVSVASAALMSVALGPVGDLLLVAPLFLDSPLVNEAQALWATTLQACAALALLWLFVNQALSTAWRGGPRAG